MCSVILNRDVDAIYAFDEKLKREDVKVLLEWAKKQPHLPPLLELQIILFLHSCYYSAEAAKITINTFFTNRTKYLHIFEHLNEEDLKKTASVIYLGVLPKRTPQNFVVLLSRLVEEKLENFNFPRIIRMFDMVSALKVVESGPFEGVVAVFDAKGATLGHLAKFNLMILKHALDHLQEGAPVRIKEIHLINAFAIVDKSLTLLKPFLKGELFSMIHVHSNLQTFYQHVPKSCLPEDYGGELPCIRKLREENLEHLLENYEFFRWGDVLRVDENKRLEKSDTFGIEGTFKKLEID